MRMQIRWRISSVISRRVPWALFGAVTMALRPGPAQAEAADGAGDAALATVTIVAAGTSNMTAASSGDVDWGPLASQPLLRPAAVLENVPGLIDHGAASGLPSLTRVTDLPTVIDDTLVNMPSHAHTDFAKL